MYLTASDKTSQAERQLPQTVVESEEASSSSTSDSNYFDNNNNNNKTNADDDDDDDDELIDASQVNYAYRNTASFARSLVAGD